MIFRKANRDDLEAIAAIYEDIHTGEERGRSSIGWVRGVYPTKDTARQALERDDLFVGEWEGQVVGAAIINQIQVDVYEGAAWEHPAPAEQVMVLHTLVISPSCAGKGFGRAFVGFYERYALEQNCPYLRMDTNEKNARARRLYQTLGYREIGCVPCRFNGIEGVGLVLLEKKLG